MKILGYSVNLKPIIDHMVESYKEYGLEITPMNPEDYDHRRFKCYMRKYQSFRIISIANSLIEHGENAICNQFKMELNIMVYQSTKAPHAIPHIKEEEEEVESYKLDLSTLFRKIPTFSTEC